MDWFIIGLTLDTLGKIMLGVTVLMVHWHVLKEHKIDMDVLRIMKKEQALGISSIFLIVAGFILQVFFRA